MKTWKNYLGVCIVFALLAMLSSCSLTKNNNADHFHLTKIVTLNNNMIAYCDKQNTVEHEIVTGELDEILAQQQELISIRDEMHMQKGYDKDVLKIIDNEIEDIDMMFGEYKGGVGTVPEKHYMFFASYLKQTNVNLQVFLDH